MMQVMEEDVEVEVQVRGRAIRNTEGDGGETKFDTTWQE